MWTAMVAQSGEVVAMAPIVGAFGIAALAIVGGFVKRVMITREQEQSRREIAAYVAEGSMTPEQGERLLNAGKRAREG